LAVDPCGRRFDPDPVGDPQPAGLDGSRRALESVVAVAGDQDWGWVEPGAAGPREGDNEVKLLFGRLEAIRLEVEQMRRNGAIPFEEIDPKWTGLLPWRMVPGC
jgi:hypothetical protein